MMHGMEHEFPNAASAKAKLKRQWRQYEKPVNAQALERRFSLDDLVRVANVDAELGVFLKKIGLT